MPGARRMPARDLVDRIEERGEREQAQRLERAPFDRERVEDLRQIARGAQRKQRRAPR